LSTHSSEDLWKLDITLLLAENARESLVKLKKDTALTSSVIIVSSFQDTITSIRVSTCQKCALDAERMSLISALFVEEKAE
jgi:hypothetical protein